MKFSKMHFFQNCGKTAEKLRKKMNKRSRTVKNYTYPTFTEPSKSGKLSLEPWKKRKTVLEPHISDCSRNSFSPKKGRNLAKNLGTFYRIENWQKTTFWAQQNLPHYYGFQFTIALDFFTNTPVSSRLRSLYDCIISCHIFARFHHNGTALSHHVTSSRSRTSSFTIYSSNNVFFAVMKQFSSI